MAASPLSPLNHQDQQHATKQTDPNLGGYPLNIFYDQQAALKYQCTMLSPLPHSDCLSPIS